jgi:hypothetical protein
MCFVNTWGRLSTDVSMTFVENQRLMLLLFEDLYGRLWRDVDAKAHADTDAAHRVPPTTAMCQWKLVHHNAQA